MSLRSLVLLVRFRREGCRAVLTRYDAFEEVRNAKNALWMHENSQQGLLSGPAMGLRLTKTRKACYKKTRCY